MSLLRMHMAYINLAYINLFSQLFVYTNVYTSTSENEERYLHQEPQRIVKQSAVTWFKPLNIKKYRFCATASASNKDRELSLLNGGGC